MTSQPLAKGNTRFSELYSAMPLMKRMTDSDLTFVGISVEFKTLRGE